MIGDKEKDEIEMEMVSFIKTCSASVEQMSKTVTVLQERKAVMRLDLSEQAIAHHHGMVRSLRSVCCTDLKSFVVVVDIFRSL